MKLTRKITALLLALLMSLTVPVSAYAVGTYDIDISISQASLFEGGEYTLTATISNATKADAQSSTVFEWSSSPKIDSLQNSSNKIVTENSDGTTYTVKQDAKFTAPAAGTNFSITAKYGTNTKTVSFTSKQPITSFDFSCPTYDHAYYDSKTNTIYADRLSDKNSTEEFFDINLSNIQPDVHQDYYADSSLFSFSSSLNKTLNVTANNDTSFSFTIPSDATGKFQLKMQTFSNLNTKKCDVQICVPAKSYKLKYAGTGLEICDVTEDTAADISAMSMIQGEATTVNATLNPSESNDDIKYTLYKDDNATLVDNKDNEYYIQNGNSCTLTGKLSQGTYYLRVKNNSMDNGMLKRTLGEKTIILSVNKATYISNINLFKVEEGAITDKPLSDITLYKEAQAANKRTFNLNECVVCTPNVEDTTGDSYYFESTNTNVATVDANGKIEAKGKGTAIIRVKSTKNNNAYAELNVTVKTGTNSLAIQKEDGKTVIASGHVEKMIATRTPSDADDNLYWYSNNDSVLHIDSNTGIITAGNVNSTTQVKISANADSLSTESSIFIDVVPAVRATSLTLDAKAYNADNSESTSAITGDKTYKDYYMNDVKKLRYFVVTANTVSPNGECNDVLAWKVNYDNGIGLSLEEAATEGLITYQQITPNQYKITPLQLGKYGIICTATLNADDIKTTDPSDSIAIETLQTANTISVKDAGTDNNTPGTVYLPIGGTREITVKTSTFNNDKKIDPPTCTIVEGGEFISITQKTSSDGEGITYTVKGLKYGTKQARICFAPRSGNISPTYINIFVRNNLNDVEVKGVPASVVYTGNEFRFDNDIKLYVNGSSIDKSQYRIQYINEDGYSNVNVGTAKIKITGLGNYEGSERYIYFKITPKPFDSTVEFSTIYDYNITKDNRKAEPVPGVRFNNRGLSKDNDFTISYKNNTQAGTGTVIITGKGNYKGTASTTFKIIDTAEFFSIGAIPVQTYSGKEIKPVPTVKYKGKALKLGKDFELSYSNNTYTGNATVTVKGIGYYRDSKSTTFQIKPRPAYLKKVKKGKKKFTAKWSKLDDVHGYQIMYARDKKFKKGKKSVIVADGYATSFTVEKLKRKKTYYVCVRAYKNVDGKNVYGNWSKTKKVKTK